MALFHDTTHPEAPEEASLPLTSNHEAKAEVLAPVHGLVPDAIGHAQELESAKAASPKDTIDVAILHELHPCLSGRTES